ncbi:hypothetical protein [Candidatus Methanodesulfokora washburnensis]|jgi:hypothetical protein|uniref:Uncharacterized protein n=1 Tax=Candidatus Methanodesulfokora washburnensis TaxID=2478471 RepID=A0A3R9RNQ6_9CREN|nr:hypothetical protein [Candidatus Methanodesulfokores washburnensis]RSN74690.1 hypothetical protein D6D85_07505 [Candidatus Methanodesulfokores washburnensis]
MAMKFRLFLIPLMFLLLPLEPALAQQDPLALSAEGIRLSAHYFLSIPSYSNIADVKAFGWVGGIIFTYQPYAFSAVPDDYSNLYAGLIMSEALLHKGFVSFNEGNLSAKIKGIVDYFLSKRTRNLWTSEASGYYIDVKFSSNVLLLLSNAQALGIIDAENEIKNAAYSLVKLQDKSGGWAPQPESYYQREPDPLTTSYVLSALIAVRKLYDVNVDDNIRSAITYLEQKASSTGWLDPVKDSIIVSSLIEAEMLGFDVDQNLLSKVASELKQHITSNPAPTIDNAVVFGGLLRLASAGILDTEDVLSSFSGIAVSIARAVNKDGLPPYGYTPFIWTRCQETYDVLRFFEAWLRSSSITVMVSALSGFISENKTVENSTLKLQVLVKNNLEREMKLKLLSDPSDPITGKASLDMSINPGSSSSVELQFKTPPKLQQPRDSRIRLTLIDPLTKEFLYTKIIVVRVLRDANIAIVQKKVDRQSMSLKDTALVVLAIENQGDIPAVQVKIAERLGAGFDVIGKDNGTAIVVQTQQKGFYFLEKMDPWQRITFIYTVKASSPPPGVNNLSTTSIEYVKALGSTGSTESQIKVNITRPLISLIPEDQQVRMEWGALRNMTFRIENTGNAEARDIEIKFVPGEGISLSAKGGRVDPDGSVHLYVGNLSPMNSIKVYVAAKASDLYPSLDLKTYVKSELSYKDNMGRFLDEYRLSAMTYVDMVMSTFAMIIISIVVLIIAAIAVLRIYRSYKIRSERIPKLKFEKKGFRRR